MNSSKLRKRKPINYYEPDEPQFDEYIYCESCYDFVYEYCAIHGPLLVIPDNEVTSRAGIPPWVPYAALTTPTQFVHIAPSVIPGAGLGIFSSLTLPRGVRFGPYCGKITDNINSMYSWQIRTENNYSAVDAVDAESSNWMRYVNCARNWHEQNLVAFQYQGQIYYRTIKIIPKFTELMVFYGSEFAHALGIDLKNYNNSQRIIVEKFIIEENTPYPIETNNSQRPLYNTEVLEIYEENPKSIIDDEQVYQESEVFNGKPHTDINYNLDTNTANINKQNLSTPLKTDSRKSVCDICNKVVSNNNFKKHRRTHENESFFCLQCSYKTNVSNRFKIHMKRHTKDELYECDSCPYIGYYRKYFRRHYKTMHKKVLPIFDDLDRFKIEKEKTLFNCLKCSFETHFKQKLAYHLETHKIIYYQCDTCGYKSNVRKNFVSHIRKVHNK